MGAAVDVVCGGPNNGDPQRICAYEAIASAANMRKIDAPLGLVAISATSFLMTDAVGVGMIFSLAQVHFREQKVARQEEHDR